MSSRWSEEVCTIPGVGGGQSLSKLCSHSTYHCFTPCYSTLAIATSYRNGIQLEFYPCSMAKRFQSFIISFSPLLTSVNSSII